MKYFKVRLIDFRLTRTKRSRLGLQRSKLQKEQSHIKRQSILDRKQDAHDKIVLGGLIVKAGLRNEDKAVILGYLLELKNQIDTPEIREKYRISVLKELK